mgnify:CR=1 FL=1
MDSPAPVRIMGAACCEVNRDGTMQLTPLVPIYLISVIVTLYVALQTWQHRSTPVSYTHLRAHETVLDLVCRLLLEKKKITHTN